ncbi:MAG: DMT family transporter [Rhodospirillaceae bacterium]|jgi:drug/metabolite transporter (DMT)-like permease|nr:DMT family transporter [Rhodospirillaceae bacterium]MBT5245870.1 DMT family transporter [Rhodospirillaceae bacterium]MBT5561177.1 DMT family transporter [Rhodospirillaceae bacterium]MBT6242871.1 DMT family transporter [Rhodospirillaceae bacterium]MBT7136810.1 DMT family transporter [Rhodospirillaceae bacterium]
MNHQTTTTQSTDTMGRFLALGSATFLGLNTTLARLAYEGGSNPGTVVFLRISLTALAIGILIALTRRGFSLPRMAILPLIGVSASVVLQGTSYLSSVSYIPVGLAVLLFYTYPLMVAAASQFIDKQKIDRARLIAFGAAFIGIGMAVGPSFNVLDWRGIVLALMGGFGVMATFMFTSRALKYVKPTSVSFYSNVFAVPMMAVMMVMLGGFEPPTTGMGIAGLTGVCVFYGLAILMLYAAIHSIGKTMTALLSNLEPLVSIIAAALILGETLTGIQYLGGLIVVISLVTGDWMARRRTAQ